MSEPVTHPDDQIMLMRQEARNYAAQAAKAEKEARWYPLVALLIAAITSVPLWGAVAAALIIVSKWTTH